MFYYLNGENSSFHLLFLKILIYAVYSLFHLYFMKNKLKQETSNIKDEQNQKLFFERIDKPCYD